MNAFLVSTLAVAIAEIGDKTQLLSLLLAARFRKPWPIVLGIFIATLANHAVAGAAGAWIRDTVDTDVLRWLLALGFIAIGIWTLKPDRLEDNAAFTPSRGVFLVTLIAFFFAEIGDKTQVATVALAIRYDALTAVVAGTTVGMLVVNVPLVLIGQRMAPRLPLKYIRWAAAALFFFLGLAIVLRG